MQSRNSANYTGETHRRREKKKQEDQCALIRYVSRLKLHSAVAPGEMSFLPSKYVNVAPDPRDALGTWSVPLFVQRESLLRRGLRLARQMHTRQVSWLGPTGETATVSQLTMRLVCGATAFLLFSFFFSFLEKRLTLPGQVRGMCGTRFTNSSPLWRPRSYALRH